MNGRLAGASMKPPHWALALTEAPRALYEAAQLPLAGLLLRRLRRGDGHGVMVIPGFMGEDDFNRPLVQYLRDMGYRADGWGQGRNLGPNSFDMEDLRKRLAGLAKGRPVSLVGHSLGGIYAREIAREAPQAIRQVISLGSPFADARDEGSNASRLYRRLNPDNPRGHRRTELGIAPPVPTTAIYTRGDGIVNWRTAVQAQGHHQTQNLEVPGSHIGLTLNPLVWYLIADRLAQPADRWRPHPSPLFHRVH